MILSAFTLFHVALSLAAIGFGFVVLYGLLTAQRFEGWNALFLWTTVGTSVTGFMFPFRGFQPAHGVGILSLIILAVAIAARYRFRLEGSWRRAYAISAVIALYFNAFVLVVQSFQKIPALKALAPTQSELPFKIAEVILLVTFIALGVRAASRFSHVPPRAA